MIVISMVLVVVGFVTLMLGVLDVGDNPLNFVYVSIGACILAGVFLIAGVLRSRPSRRAESPQPAAPAAPAAPPPPASPSRDEPSQAPVSEPTRPLGDPSGRTAGSLTQSLLRDRDAAEARTHVRSVSADDEAIDEEELDEDEFVDEEEESDVWGPTVPPVGPRDAEDEDLAPEPPPRPAKGSSKKAAAKKAGTKSAAKKSAKKASKKSAAKKSTKKAGTKAAATKAAAKKSAAKKSAAKKSTKKAGTKATAKKSAKKASKKSAAKKSAAKKSAASAGDETAAVGQALEGLSGLGPTKQRRLVERFGGVEGLRAADAAEIAEVEGVSRNLASQIKERLGS